MLLQKTRDYFVIHMTKVAIEKVFPDYNKQLRAAMLAQSALKCQEEKERKSLETFRSSYVGMVNGLVTAVMQECGLSSLFRSTGGGNKGPSSKEKDDKNENTRKDNRDKSKYESEKGRKESRESKESKETEEKMEMKEKMEKKEKKEREEREDEESEDMCPICLNTFKNVPAKMLPCGHGIHSRCLKTLSKQHTTCGYDYLLCQGLSTGCLSSRPTRATWSTGQTSSMQSLTLSLLPA